MIQIRFDFQNIDKILRSNLKTEIPVRKVAELVAKDITDNIKFGRSFDGSPIPEKTWGNKIRFLYKGSLRKSVIINENNPNDFNITIDIANKQKGIWLQTGTSRYQEKPYKFFGLNRTRLKSEIDNILKQETKVSFQ